MDYLQKISVPMSLPDITDKEREAVAKVMATNYLSMGPYVLSFEQAFREFTGAKHAIAVNSGTAGLHLCVRAAGWSDGDRVITTPFSFVSSTNVLLYERITPIFVDAEPLTGNIDPDKRHEVNFLMFVQQFPQCIRIMLTLRYGEKHLVKIKI